MASFHLSKISAFNLQTLNKGGLKIFFRSWRPTGKARGVVQPTKTIAAMVRADERLKKEFPLITLPVLILHGTLDKAEKSSGSQLFYDKAGSTDKTLKLYDGGFHDPLNDLDKKVVLADIQRWIAEHIPAGVVERALLHGKPIFVAEWGVRHNGSVLTAAQQNQWLNAMFDYFDSHAQIKAIAYFNYSMINDATWNNPPCPGGLAYLFGGLVNYCPNRNDLDHRLLADSGAGFRATFSARIASSRYSSQLRQ